MTVLTRPDGRLCSVSDGDGTQAGAAFDGVMVDCVAIELSLSLGEINFPELLIGRGEQQSLTLLNSGTENLVIESLGAPVAPFSVDESACSPCRWPWHRVNPAHCS